MRRSLAIKMLSILVGACTLGVAAGTAAWFVPVANLTAENSPIDGVSEGAYFAYGDGTASKPFGIRKPRHLYNLAWLQYLGFFNEDKFGKGTKQYHFELAADIPMGGMAIPPIGTEDYPFVGHFDGNNKIVSDFTTSNKFSDLKKHPAVVNSTNFKLDKVKVVGFFGVVGNYQTAVAAADYSSLVNTITDTGLTDFTVRTVADETLVGLAAGYVDATISNVAVDVGTIDVDNESAAAYNESVTKRLSDYSLIGFTTQKQDVNRYSSSVYNLTTTVVPEAFTVDEESDTPGWGGSLNMVEMYDNLRSVWDNFTSGRSTPGGQNQEQYVSSRTIYKNRDGTEDLSRRVEQYTRLTDKFTDNGNYNYYGWEQKNDAGKVTASYNFVINPSGSYSNESKYMCLSGERSVSLTGKTTTTTTHAYEKFVGHRVSYGSNYLSIDGSGSVINQTNAANATAWVFDASTSTFYANDDANERSLYLICDASGNLSISASASGANIWSEVDGVYFATLGSNQYALDFNGTVWTTCSVVARDYYQFRETSTNTYLSAAADGDHLMATSSSQSDISTRWKRNGNNVESVLYPNNFICIYETYYSYDSYVITSSSGDYPKFTFDGSNFKSEDTPYYFYKDDDYILCSNSYYASSIAVIAPGVELGDDAVHADKLVYSADTYPDGYRPATTVTYPTAVLNTKPTYFPLKHVNGVPKPENTGYLVSGANSHNTSPYGDIRVSKYAATQSGSHILKNSINTKTHTLKTVYTINDSTTARKPTTLPTDLTNKDETTNAKYPKYYKSLKKMNDALTSDTSNIYGLHFMDATIGGADHSQRVYVGSATINKSKPMLNYPLPTDCIDFNLKDKGAINFFAGTYFAGSNISGNPNDSFFALYDIERNPNTYAIESLKEITAVWKHKTDETAPYVYQYSGTNQYSVSPFDSDNYEVVFKTSWIKQQSSKGEENGMLRYYSAYYFEIPMNEGEYCLGSVPNASGAYLMYLDIGANAQKLNRTIFGEKYKTIQKIYDYPLGVAIVETATMSDALQQLNGKAVDAENSACVSIYAGYSGSFNLSRVGNQVDLSVETGEKIKGAYIYDQIALHDPGGTVEGVPKIEKTTILSRTEYFDYDAIKQETTRTLIDHKQVSAVDDMGNALSTYTLDEKSYLQRFRAEEDDAAGVWHDVAEADWVVYQHDGSDIGKPYASMSSVPMQEADSLVLLEYQYSTPQSVSAEETRAMIPVLDAANACYSWSGIDADVKSSNSNKVTLAVLDPANPNAVTITVVSGQDGSKTVAVAVASTGGSYTIKIVPSVTSA